VFLQQQAEDAKQAMQQTFGAIRQTAKEAADVELLTRAYPWASVGAAAIAGFMAASLLPKSGSKDRVNETQVAASSSSHSTLKALVHSSLMGVVRSTVISVLTNIAFSDDQPSDDDHVAPGAGREPRVQT